MYLNRNLTHPPTLAAPRPALKTSSRRLALGRTREVSGHRRLPPEASGQPRGECVPRRTPRRDGEGVPRARLDPVPKGCGRRLGCSQSYAPYPPPNPRACGTCADRPRGPPSASRGVWDRLAGFRGDAHSATARGWARGGARQSKCARARAGVAARVGRREQGGRKRETGGGS